MIGLFISQIFIKIIGLVYKLYLTNKEGFGDCGNAIYSSGFQIYAMLLTFSSTGVPNAISKLVSERLAIGDTKGAHSIFKIAFITFALIGAIGSIILFLFAKLIATDLIQIPEAEYSLIALSPSIFFVSIVAVIRGYFNGRQIFSATAKSQSIEQVLKTIFTILVVEFLVKIGKRNIAIMAAGANLATTIATIFSFIYIYLYYKNKREEIYQEVKQSVNHKITRIRKTIKKIITVAFPISLSSLISSFNKNIDSFTIVRLLKKFMTVDEAKIQYGILSGKIDSLCALPLCLNVSFVTILVPKISNSMARGDYTETKKNAEKFILLSILISFPIMAIMFLFSKQILELLFPNAINGNQYLKISSFSIVFIILAQTINAILQGIGKVNIPAISFGFGLIIKIICNICLIQIKNIGINGAIVGNILCNLTAVIISYCILYKNLFIKINIVNFILKPILATIIMSIFSIVIFNKLKCIILGQLAIIITLITGIVIYIIMIVFFRILEIKEIVDLFKNKKYSF